MIDSTVLQQLRRPFTNGLIGICAIGLPAGQPEGLPDDIVISTTNTAPVAIAQEVYVDQGTSLSITLTGQDAQGDSLGYIIDSIGSYGIITGTAPNLT